MLAFDLSDGVDGAAQHKEHRGLSSAPQGFLQVEVLTVGNHAGKVAEHEIEEKDEQQRCELPVYGFQKCQYGKGDADKQASELFYHGLVLLSTPDSSMTMNVRFFDVMFMFTLFFIKRMSFCFPQFVIDHNHWEPVIGFHVNISFVLVANENPTEAFSK